MVSATSSRRRFTAVRRRRAAAPPAQEERTENEPPELCEAAPAARLWHSTAGLRQIAQLLWLGPDYSGLFEVEYKMNLEACGGSLLSILPPSSYRRRLQGEAAQHYDARRRRQERDGMATALHAANQQRWSPSLLARSICYYKSASSFITRTEGAQRRLASRPVTLDVCKMMAECRPPSAWATGRHVFVYAFDQTYEWISMKKHGRRRVLERVDAHGMPIQITNEVYINSIQLQLPASLGDLSDADRARIRANHGSAYTEDFEDVLDHLAPRVLQRALDDLATDALAPVAQRVATDQVEPAQLTLRQIATGLFGRGAVDPGGPADFDILPVLPRTDTKSDEDFTKIASHLESHDGPEGEVDVGHTDGQGVLGQVRLKKRHPHRYARWVPGCGPFHEHAHSLFGWTEMFWPCFVCWCLNVIGMKLVQEITQHLGNNAYAHHLQAHIVITIAVVSFLVQDVVEPPPRVLLSRGLDVYLAYVQSAGGEVVCEYLRHAGFPNLQWQRSARNAQPGKLKQLYAYSFHIFRSTCHKPVAAQIALVTLVSFHCTIASVQAILCATFAISLLGRLSSCTFIDRVMEFTNNEQQSMRRSAHAASFGRTMDVTPLLRGMMHVRHAFQATEHGTSDGDDPITDSMLVQARLLQDELRRLLGTDLTVATNTNPFWHTGNPVAHNGDMRTHRPWEWVWRVADATSHGKGPPMGFARRAERWDVYVRRYIRNSMFPF